MSCHTLLQETFLTQGLNPCLLSPALAGGFFTTSATGEALSFTAYWFLILHQTNLLGI